MQEVHSPQEGAVIFVMSGKGKSGNRDPRVGRRETAREALPVPRPIFDETTVPVDVAELEPVVAACRQPEARGGGPHVIARPASLPGEDPRSGELLAELQVSGTAQVVVLPVRNLSHSGCSLEVPEGTDLHLREGATVMVHLLLPSEQYDPAATRFRAHVAHRRLASRGKPGGMALRWHLDDAQSAASLDKLLLSIKAD